MLVGLWPIQASLEGVQHGNPGVSTLMASIANSSAETAHSPLVLILIEIAIVIGFSRLVGALFQRIHQPLVIGEIIAGIALGPSFLGLMLPNLQQSLFPDITLSSLEVLANIGLIFFMFLIGLELNPRYLQGQLKVAIATSNGSIIVPFGLSIALAAWLYPQISDSTVSFTAFALFLSSSLSITAFPVLARIITENNLQNSRLGTLALTSAAVNDMTAWCLLALAVAVTRTNSIWAAWPTLTWSLLYGGFMLTVARRWLKRLALFYTRAGRLNQWLLAGIYLGVLISALITDWIGIHLIFGAFLLGAVMPKNAGLTRELALRTEDFVLTFLLPIFFVYSGLRTDIGNLNTPYLWLLCSIIISVAVVGKVAGTYIAARWCNIIHQEAAVLGWLMNTRGLTELVILNIGLELGVINATLFTMLVIMALATTLMTAPMLKLLYPNGFTPFDSTAPTPAPPDLPDPAPLPPSPQLPAYQVLVPVANPRSYRGLMQIARSIAFPLDRPSPPTDLHQANAFQSDALQANALQANAPQHEPSQTSGLGRIYPLNLLEIEENYAFESMPTEVELQIQSRLRAMTQVIDQLAGAGTRGDQRQGVIQPIIRATTDVAWEVRNLVETQNMDLVILGWHRATFLNNRLGGRVGKILQTVPVDVGVWIERASHYPWRKLLVAYGGSSHDDLALTLALRILANDDRCTLQLLRVHKPQQAPVALSNELDRLIQTLDPSLRDRLTLPILKSDSPLETLVEAANQSHLTLVGTSMGWGQQSLGLYSDELVNACGTSLLIVRKFRRTSIHFP